jgi:hypothetical protein
MVNIIAACAIVPSLACDGFAAVVMLEREQQQAGLGSDNNHFLK